MAENEQKTTFFYTEKDEDKLIGVLESDADLKEKCDVLREIGRVATEKSIPTLAKLLSDEKLAHRARYALEMMPHPSVDDVLREAMTGLKGSLLAGVVMSLGTRRDTQAVDALAASLSDSDPDVAAAAAYALGNIGTKGATDALLEALPESTGAFRDALCEGLFRSAEGMKAAGWRDNALVVYDRLRTLKEPRHVREAALEHSVSMRR